MHKNPLPVSGKAQSENRREQLGWYFYDWANSAFYTSVVTVFIGPYLTTITRAAADANGFVYPLGIKVSAGAYFPYIVSLAVALQVIFLPIAGAIADYSRLKKQMLGVCAYVGALAAMGMYFLQGTHYLLGGALFLLANLSFGASIVFYNAFLPEIAAPEERDHVSSMGWALGYLGGGLLLGLNLWLVSQAANLGLTTEQAVRISLAGILNRPSRNHQRFLQERASPCNPTATRCLQNAPSAANRHVQLYCNCPARNHNLTS